MINFRRSECIIFSMGAVCFPLSSIKSRISFGKIKRSFWNSLSLSLSMHWFPLSDYYYYYFFCARFLQIICQFVCENVWFSSVNYKHVNRHLKCGLTDRFDRFLNYGNVIPLSRGSHLMKRGEKKLRWKKILSICFWMEYFWGFINVPQWMSV